LPFGSRNPDKHVETGGMLRRALAPALLLAALAVPVHADPVPAAVTHGTVEVGLQTFRCEYWDFRLTGSFLVGARTWHGAVYGGTCNYPGDPNGPLLDVAFRLNGTSADGVLVLDCTTNMTLDPDSSGDPMDPAAFACRATLNGGTPLPLAFAMKTHDVPPRPPYTVREGSFYGA
jgi:hypothetical protein